MHVVVNVVQESKRLSYYDKFKVRPVEENTRMHFKYMYIYVCLNIMHKVTVLSVLAVD